MADQDWIGLIIFKNLEIRTGSDSILSDQDWTRTEKFHSLLSLVVSILLHEAKPVLGLFCFHLNTIG